MTPNQIATLRDALQRPRYELVPITGATDQIGLLPPESSVAITASPRHGMGPTLDLALTLREAGHRPVPHIAARSILAKTQLEEMLEKLAAVGVDEVFVVGGDRPEPAGPYPDGLALLSAMEELGMLPERIGAPGYPEGHHIVTNATIEQALRDKSRYLSYLTSQMCFSHQAIDRWLGHLQAVGPDLPVRIGIPGVVDAIRLAAIGGRIGVGPSLRFLTASKGLMRRLASAGKYQPSNLVTGLAQRIDDRVLGFHIYTFNQVRRTEEWRLGLLEETASWSDTF